MILKREVLLAVAACALLPFSFGNRRAPAPVDRPTALVMAPAINDVCMGMSLSEVTSKLGQPETVENSQSKSGQLKICKWPRSNLEIWVEGSRVCFVSGDALSLDGLRLTQRGVLGTALKKRLDDDLRFPKYVEEPFAVCGWPTFCWTPPADYQLFLALAKEQSMTVTVFGGRVNGVSISNEFVDQLKSQQSAGR